MTTADCIEVLVLDAQDKLALERDHAARLAIAGELVRTVREIAEQLQGADVAAMRLAFRAVEAALGWRS